ncbi:MAG: hypothetical protein ACETWD_10260 [Desulfatiglandales bacterium]
MKLPTTPFYLSHEAIGTKGHLTTREIERIWGATLFFLVSFELMELSIHIIVYEEKVFCTE